MVKQNVLVICGVKNSGKTTLVEKVVSALVEKGMRIATIKRDAHHFEPDVPGRDSYRHRAAGAYGTAVFDTDKFMIIKDGKQTVEAMLREFPEADMIIVEGAHETEYPRVEIVRGGNSKAPVSGPERMVALVTDLPLALDGIPTIGLNDTDALVRRIFEYFALG